MWVGRAAAFRDSFAKLCAHTAPMLLDAVDTGPGTRLLDIGTGTGTVAAAASARGARVTAVDAEPGMIELARQYAPEAEFHLAVLPDLPFAPGSFEAVVANFVVNHVGRPTAALGAMRDVARPGGRVAATIWCSPAGAGHELVDRAVEAAGVGKAGAPPRLDPAEEFPRTAEGFAALFTAAGLADVSCEPMAWDHVAAPEEWWSGPAAGVGLLGHTIGRQSPETVARIKAAYDELAPHYTGPDGRLVLRYHALLARGRA